MVKKLTCKKLREMIRDEEHDSKKYKGYGLNNISRDEKKHSRMLKQKLKKC